MDPANNLVTDIQPPPDIRRRLEAAVLSVFSRKDFHRVHIRDIAQQAGVGFGTIYKYYGSKEKLLFAFVGEWLGEFAERILDHLQGLEDPKEKLRKVMWVMLDYYERHPDVARILLLSVPHKTWMADPTYRQTLLYDVFLGVVRQSQAEGVLNARVRPGMLIDALDGLVHRAVSMWIYHGQIRGLTEQAGFLFEILWHGVSNPDRPLHREFKEVAP
ncbi:MAG: TetR/AcrR family transcriptional regulator [Proteobacteria bacterium]|nr:TetR/AcrR family transcriptional regulator [Pseudomonadota bacterium]